MPSSPYRLRRFRCGSARRSLQASLLLIGLWGCAQGSSSSAPDASPSSSPLDALLSAAASASVQPPASAPPEEQGLIPGAPPCPAEMLLIPGPKAYCIDRWEAILVDKNSGTRLSPYYPVDRSLASRLAADWEQKRRSLGNEQARSMPVPPLAAWQQTHDPVPMAQSRPGQVPNGYLSGKVAKAACENAGKRLCSQTEWVHACRGLSDQPFPYGPAYRQGACNVFRANHPAKLLHDDASSGHLDPRLNLTRDEQGLLLRKTGESQDCQSRWPEGTVFDMVGNLDEWVEDPEGLFLGGFYSRSKKDGCASAVRNHPFNYFDYSLGVRCCKDL